MNQTEKPTRAANVRQNARAKISQTGCSPGEVRRRFDLVGLPLGYFRCIRLCLLEREHA